MFNFDGMNENQIKAVKAVDRPVLIIAGPGTGKTYTLVKRIAYLVSEKGVAPSEIMAVTFTEKAARELITRISNEFAVLGSDANINDMYIGTFHSIALGIIKELSGGTGGGKRIIDSFETTYLICRNMSKFRFLSGFDKYFPDTLGVWDQAMEICRYVGRSVEELADTDAMLNSCDNDAALLGKMIVRYKEILDENNVIDFSSILLSLYNTLKGDKGALEMLNERIKYIMVDEYQDTNYIQEQLIFMLGGKSRNICVVGDDDQGLYRFRGATIRNILEFPQKFPQGECKQIYLDINYRSEPGIIDFCGKWMDDAPFSWDGFRYPKKLRSGRTNCQMTHSVFRCTADHDGIEHSLLETVRHLYDGGYISDYNQIAFLFSSVKSGQAAKLAEYFEANGIHIYSPRSKMFFERLEIKQIMGCLIMCFGNYLSNLKKNSFVHKISDRLRDYYKSCAMEASVLIKSDEHLHRYISAEFESIRNIGTDSNKTLLDILYKLLSFRPFSEHLSASPDSVVTKTRAARNLSEVSRMISHFSKMHNMHFINNMTANNLPEQFFNIYIRFHYTDGIGEYEDTSEYAPHGCISFMTIHQAKGLEFPVTIVGSLDKRPYRKADPLMLTAEMEYFPRKAFEPLEEIMYFDFQRLYYTAFSRAQDMLVLIDGNKNGGYFSDSTSKLPDISHFADGGKVFSPIKPVKYKKVYSYTSHITLYDGCSLQYKFYKEYGFSQHNMMHTSIGSLVHATLEDINRYAIEGRSDELSEEKIKELFVTNYSSVKEKTGYNLSSSQFDNALGHVLRYYSNRKSELYKAWKAEDEIELILPNFILQGIVDLAEYDKEADVIDIVDYKTGPKPNTENDPHSTDHYRKQLEIYAYLMERKYNKPVRYMKLYYTSVTDGDPYIIFEYKKDRINSTISEITSTIEKIESKKFDDGVNNDYACRFCDMKYVCGKSEAMKGILS